MKILFSFPAGLPQQNACLRIICRVLVRFTAVLYGLAVLTPQLSAADFGTPIWTNRYDGLGNNDDQATAVAVDGSGNVFVTGMSRLTPFGGYDYATLAYSAAGVPLWTNRYDGPGNINDTAVGVAVDSSGNVFVTGYSAPTDIQFNNDYATIKYSGAGVPLWTNRYNGPGNDNDEARGIAVDGNGNVIVTGLSYGVGGYDFATLKYSSAGVSLWTNRHEGGALALAVDNNNNVFVTGAGSSGYATVAYSGAGLPLWTNLYTGPGCFRDQANAIAVDTSGNVFVTGFSEAVRCFNHDYVTIKYSGAGVPLWTNRYNGPGNNNDDAQDIAVDAGGNVFVTGRSWNGTNDDYATVAYSGAGTPLWTNRHDGQGNIQDAATAMAVDSSGNVFVTGRSSTATNGSYCYLTLAYSGAGVPLWTNSYDKVVNAVDQAKGIVVDGSGNVLVTGSSTATPLGNGDYVTIKHAGFNSGTLKITNAAAQNGKFQFLFNGEANRAYTVEFRGSMNAGNWETLMNIAAQPTATNISITNAITNNACFYRVRTP